MFKDMVVIVDYVCGMVELLLCDEIYYEGEDMECVLVLMLLGCMGRCM